ncbi:MAG: TGS domain-containing protein [Candidatus Caldarchaeum sp.]|nr:TGS domain-containing protein [Candidatus Caldarchaeum sp.]MCX8201413.1 TGS domain-containing protein [Candidatus Caldarchaeum sp.]MDW8063686.1 TGS domain-containing protein [Candidatus Caldarchaeum sp.]
MPTNLPAEAQAKLAKYQEARTVEEKIKALEEALPLIPDHKGTEKMRAQLKTTLAKLRKELEKKKSTKTSRTDVFSFKKEGAATVVLLGSANSGKSTLLRILTNAKPEVSEYEMTTVKPVPAMMFHQDVGIQLVELPAVITSKLEETPFTSRSIAAARNADMIIIMVDGMNNPYQQFTTIVEMLEESGIVLGVKDYEVVLEKKDSGGLRLVVFGRFRDSYEELRQQLLQIGIRNAVVKIYGDAGVDEVVEQVLRPTVFKKSVVVMGRADAATKEDVEKLKKAVEKMNIPLFLFSEGHAFAEETFVKKVFESLDLVRIYTQKDGVVNRRPVVMKKGTTVGELAQIIHKEIAKELKFAKVWGRSVKIQGQQVGPGHVLMDGDTVELFV